MVIGGRLLQLVLGRSDVCYARTAEAHVAGVKHRVLSDGNRSLRLLQFHLQALEVCGHQQTTFCEWVAVLEAELAVEWNAWLQVGRASVDPVRLGGGQVARI